MVLRDRGIPRQRRGKGNETGGMGGMANEKTGKGILRTDTGFRHELPRSGKADRSPAGKYVSHKNALAPGTGADLHPLRGGQAGLRPQGNRGERGGSVGDLPRRSPLPGHPLRLRFLWQRFDFHGFFAAGVV